MAMAPLLNTNFNTAVNWAPQRSQTTDTTPTQLDRFSPTSSQDTGIYNWKDIRGPVMLADSAKPAVDPQGVFVSDMRKAGIQASLPPTPEQLKEYFGTFNSKDKRAQAQDKYDAYSAAFHVHTAEANGDADVKYSPDKAKFGWNHQVFDTFKQASDAADKAGPKHAKDKISDISTADASSWKDLQGHGQADGKLVQDCEGFAFMAGELLGAAGYKVQQVATQGDKGYAHAMAVVQDPDSGTYSAASNGQIFPAQDNDPDRALQHGWNVATGWKQQDHGDYYYGKTQAEAQGKMTSK